MQGQKQTQKPKKKKEKKKRAIERERKEKPEGKNVNNGPVSNISLVAEHFTESISSQTCDRVEDPL